MATFVTWIQSALLPLFFFFFASTTAKKALESFPLLLETEEDLKFSSNPSFISSLDRTDTAVSSGRDSPAWQSPSSTNQFDSAFGPDTYYAGEPFAGSRQDDSYYGGDSYGAPLSPVISTAPAAYDYGTGYGAPLAPVVSFPATTTVAPTLAPTTSALVEEAAEEVEIFDMLILGAILFFFLWPTTLQVDVGNAGVASGLFPLLNIRTPNRRQAGKKRKSKKDKKKLNEKTTAKPATETESSSVTTNSTASVTDVTESEAEKLELVETMEPRMEAMEDPGCQPHPSTLVSRLRALVWRTRCSNS